MEIRTISNSMIKKIIEIMERNTNQFKESLDNNLETRLEINKIKDTQIEILKILNNIVDNKEQK